MSVSYDKEQRAYAKANGMDLCTVAARGIVYQTPAKEIKSRLIEDCALHTMVLKEDKPFASISDIQLPSEIAEIVEQLKLYIVRQRATNFDEMPRHELMAVFNSLRHYLLMSRWER